MNSGPDDCSCNCSDLVKDGRPVNSSLARWVGGRGGRVGRYVKILAGARV